MPWFNVWDGLKNKTCRYLLQRYLGQFLEEQLNLEQLKVELYNGKATVRNVSLKKEVLNELFEAQGWALEVTGGNIGVLTVTVPWNALMTNDSSIEVSDLFITLRPIKRQNNGTSMLESMWSSVSSSLQLAEECMKQKDDDVDCPSELHTTGIAGLEKFAETIDNVLNRIQAKFSNITLNLEYPSIDGSRGIAVVINIQNLCYKNETGCEKNYTSLRSHDSSDIDEKFKHISEVFTSEKINILPTFAKHNIVLNGLRLFTEEFKMTKYDLKVSSSCSKFDKNKTNFNETIQIPILEVMGQQKIQIKMKQSEEISGPKISLDLELGSIYGFLTPRQVHLLLQIGKAFYEDDVIPCEKKGTQEHDVKAEVKIENDINNFESSRTQMTGDLSNHTNWGDDLEKPIVLSTILHENTSTTAEICCESLSSSISSNSTLTGTSKFQCKVANMESCCEILDINIRIGAVIGIILHEDILTENNIKISQNPLNEKSQIELLDVANIFFARIKEQSSDVELNSSNLLCKKNHIFWRISPVFSEGVQQRNKNLLLWNFSITATKLDFCEVLDELIAPLILFDRSEICSDGYHKRPEFTANVKSSGSCNLKDTVTTTFDINMEKSTLDLDISIFDRLSGILASSPFEIGFLTNVGRNSTVEKDINTTTKSAIEINILSTIFNIQLRFPVSDTRPIHDPNRFPWWKQNIRTDFLLFTFHQLRLKFCQSTVNIVANEVYAYYCEKNAAPKVQLFKTTLTKNENNSPTDPAVEYPTITIGIPSTESLYGFINSYSGDSNSGETFGSDEKKNQTNFPFSAKRACRHSNTMHTQVDATESETILLPAETHEIHQFCNKTMKTSKLQIRINLPVADITLESKQLYEILYNRLNCDLFMWEPSAHIFKTSNNFKMQQNNLSDNFSQSTHVPSTSFADSYKNIKSKSRENITDTTSNSSESNECDTSTNINESTFSDVNSAESIYLSTHESNNIKEIPKTTKMKLSNCSFEITIGNGSLALFVPVRGVDNHVVPGQMGKFNFIVNKIKIFSVNGYSDNADLGYVCLEISDIEIYHCGIVPGNSPLQDIGPDIAHYMQSTLYKVPLGLEKGKCAGTGNGKRKMVSLVIEIKKVQEKKIKRLRITSCIQRTTLRHHPAPSPQIWLNQLIDFLDVLDYPIEGYQPFGVITEIQLHLWDCTIDYRPKKFSYRAVMEIGSFTINSNIISSATGCNLRFVVEECILSIAPFDNLSGSFPDFKVTFIESSTLVPVLDIGLFDISLWLTGEASERCPKIDLRCSIHDVHIRTCSDSGSALAQLISHIANDGDLDDCTNKEEVTSSVSSMYSDAEIISSKNMNTCPMVSQKQQERVKIMMAEAVQETVTSSETSTSKNNSKLNKRGIEVFYFPDENKKSCNYQNFQDTDIKNEFCDLLNFETNVMLTSYYVKADTEDPLPLVKMDLGDIKSNHKCNNQSVNQEEEFCIIADDEKSFLYHCGIKSVKISSDPLRIVDNHFQLPTGKPDLLRSPENFPMVLLRYTLCEMTITWHLYGGMDFPNEQYKSDDNKIKVEKSQMSDAYRHGVSFSKGAQGIQFGKKPKEKLTWKTIGGIQRNHEVLVEMQFSKVRFSHEVYPSYTSHASRQVLLISEIEIRDRLQTSDINKFLYHPNMKNLSNKSFQHMVVIKAMHVRPYPKHSESQECSLRISLLPMRLHIDQDTLLFLVDYFGNINGNCTMDIPNVEKSHRQTQIQQLQPPIMNIEDVPEAVQDLRARRLVKTNLDLLMDDKKFEEVSATKLKTHDSALDESPVYFREVIFSPEVTICFDYHGRRVELSRGPIAGLLMGLGQLQCSEIRLQKLVYRRGLLGVEKVLTFLCKEWLRDIKRNQLPKILSGVGPTYAFVQLFQGIYDLFWLPIEQYQKDGRIMRGLQLGAQSFTARTALAALELTSRVIQLLQFTAETTFDMVSPGPSVRRSRALQKGKKKRPHRPKDIREGVANAYLILKEGINDSANILIETAVSEHDQKGYTGAVGAVMRQIPQLVVCPAVLATQATTNILGGVKSSLVPEAKIEAREKWKDDSD